MTVHTTHQINLFMTGQGCPRWSRCPFAVDTKAQLHAAQLLEAVSNAERERAAAPDELPLGEWTAFRVKPNLATQSLTTQLQLTNSGQVSHVPCLTFILHALGSASMLCSLCRCSMLPLAVTHVCDCVW